MKRKHYLLSVERQGTRYYAQRNPECLKGYRMVSDRSKAESFGEEIRRVWLKVYPDGMAEEMSEAVRPDRPARAPRAPRAPRASRAPRAEQRKAPAQRSERLGAGASAMFRRPMPELPIEKPKVPETPSFEPDEKLTSEQFYRNVVLAMPGTIVLWKPSEETLPRVYKKVGVRKFDWREILPSSGGWRLADTKGPRVFAAMLANQNMNPASFSFIFPSDPRVEGYKLDPALVSKASPRREERPKRPAEVVEPAPSRLRVDPFVIVQGDGDPPAGYEILDPRPVPGNLERSQFRSYFQNLTRRVPIIPPEVKNGSAWVEEKTDALASAAWSELMRTGGAARLYVYFLPVRPAVLEPVPELPKLDPNEVAKDIWETSSQALKKFVAVTFEREGNIESGVIRGRIEDVTQSRAERRAIEEAMKPLVREWWARNAPTPENLERIARETLEDRRRREAEAAEQEKKAAALRAGDEPEWRKERLRSEVPREKLPIFWQNYSVVMSRPGFERDLREAELEKRLNEYASMSGPAYKTFVNKLKGLEQIRLKGFLELVNARKAKPIVEGLPASTIVRVEGKPTKGFKNPTMLHYYRLDSGKWRFYFLDNDNNWKPSRPVMGQAEDSFPELAEKIATSDRSEVFIVRPETPEHDAYVEKASSRDEVTPKAVELLRDYYLGRRKRDAPKGIIRRYRGSDYSLLARALAAGLIKRHSPNDKEAVELTERGKALVGL